MGTRKVQVAVIGAGAAGLCAARHILAQPDVFAAPMVFESSDRVGGTWVYSEKTGTSDGGLPIHSSMYRHLKTNLPKEIMAYPDHPFPPNLPSFLHHTQVLAYLEGYADHFKVKEHIQFRTLVEHVIPAPRPEGETDGVMAWEVTVRSLGARGGRVTHQFDAIMVCSGHFFDPFIPALPGVENFQGEILPGSAGGVLLPSIAGGHGNRRDKEYKRYLATSKPPKNFVKLDSLKEGYLRFLDEETQFRPVPRVIVQVF